MTICMNYKDVGNHMEELFAGIKVPPISLDCSKDYRIEFHQETNAYFLDGKPENLVSVDGLTQAYFPRDRHKPVYNVRADWINSENENALHQQCAIMSEIPPANYSTKKLKFIRNFLNDYPNFSLLRSNWVVYLPDALVYGCVGLLFLDSYDNSIVLVNFKNKSPFEAEPVCKCPVDSDTRKKIHSTDSNGWPCEAFGNDFLTFSLLNTGRMHCTVQQNLLKQILEAHYSVHVDRMYILYIENSLSNYQLIETESMDEIALQILEERTKRTASASRQMVQ